MTNTQPTDELVDAVLDAIVEDVNIGDLTAIEEMLKLVPQEVLVNFLPEADYDPRVDH